MKYLYPKQNKQSGVEFKIFLSTLQQTLTKPKSKIIYFIYIWFYKFHYFSPSLILFLLVGLERSRSFLGIQDGKLVEEELVESVLVADGGV